jgi:predicted nucleotidyltransferase
MNTATRCRKHKRTRFHLDAGPLDMKAALIQQGIAVSEDRLREICRRYGVLRLALFGSILGPRFGPDSDIDLLVEFEPHTRLGLRFFELERELTELLGRKVDLNTPGFLSPEFRGKVQSVARVLYDVGT